MDYFDKNKNRFINVNHYKVDFSDPMQRPHIRFNGKSLKNYLKSGLMLKMML